jgi:HK97 family phage major capsid protein
MPFTVPVPKTSDELAEMLSDPTRSKEILKDKGTLTTFIDAYAQSRQGEGTDLNGAVASEVQRQLADYLRSAKDADGAVPHPSVNLKRLPQDVQSRPETVMTSHRQACAYNPKAVGAALDQQFVNAAEYFHSAWHLNPDAEVRGKMEALRNAYSSEVPAEGGFLVPEALRSQLLQVALESSVVRPRATVIPMETERVKLPMVDVTTNVGSVFGGMIGYWTEESAALTESQMKFAQVVLDAQKLTGLSVVPNELLQNSLISFSALIEGQWPLALAFLEDLAYVGGTGSGQPKGFQGAGNPAGIAVTKESGQKASTILLQNIVKMYSRMLPSSLNRAVWVCSPNSLPELFTMALSVGTGGSPVMLTNVAGPAPMTIFGRPLVVSEKASSLGTRGDIAFVDLSYYLIGDRQMMTASSSTEWKFGNDQTAFRIIQRVDGKPWIQSAITPANGGDTLSPFVEIATRA